MPNTQHKNITPPDIHKPISWEWANENQRVSTNVENEDLYKVGIQTDTNSLYILINTNPTWQELITEGSSVPPNGIAGGDLSGTYPNPEVEDDSHDHTPGVSIPAYPTTLPPTGNAGGDLTGTYPNPSLKNLAVTPGTYNRATVTIDSKGRVTNITANADPTQQGGQEFPGFANVTLSGAAQAPTTDYSDDSNRIATTRFVTRGNIELPKLSSGEQLTILPGYRKSVTGSYTLEANSVLLIRGEFIVGNKDNGLLEGIEVNSTPYPNDINTSPVPPIEIPEGHFKIVVSGFHIQTPIHIHGILKVI